METLGTRLRTLRGKMSQKQFSNLLDVSQENISRYENDVTLPETKILLQIQEKLNVSLDWLLRGIGSKEFVSHGGGFSELQKKQAAIEIIDSVREQFLNNYGVGKGKK